jgi:hypothetical protein
MEDSEVIKRVIRFVLTRQAHRHSLGREVSYNDNITDLGVDISYQILPEVSG